MMPDDDDSLPYVTGELRGYDSYKLANPYDSDANPAPVDWCDVRPCPPRSFCVKCWCSCESEVLSGPCPVHP